jgi:hypothetical protein
MPAASAYAWLDRRAWLLDDTKWPEPPAGYTGYMPAVLPAVTFGSSCLSDAVAELDGFELCAWITTTYLLLATCAWAG